MKKIISLLVLITMLLSTASVMAAGTPTEYSSVSDLTSRPLYIDNLEGDGFTNKVTLLKDNAEIVGNAYTTLYFTNTDYGRAIHDGRGFYTKEAFKNVAVSTRTLGLAQGQWDYYFRYKDANNYVRVTLYNSNTGSGSSVALIKKVNGTTTRLNGQYGVQLNSNNLPFEPNSTSAQSNNNSYIQNAAEVDETCYIDFLFTLENDTINVYAKYKNSAAEDKTKYVLLTSSSELDDITDKGLIRVYNTKGTVYKDFDIYADPVLTVSSDANGKILKTDDTVTITTNKAVTAAALQNAIEVTANGEEVTNFTVTNVSVGGAYKYIIRFTDGMQAAAVYNISFPTSMDDDFTGYNLAYTTLPNVTYGPVFTGVDATVDAEVRNTFTYIIQDDNHSAGKFMSSDQVVTPYGLAIRGQRIMKSPSSYRDFAMTISTIRLNTGGNKYYFRYVDKDNYLALEFKNNNKATLYQNVNGTSTQLGTVNITLPADDNQYTKDSGAIKNGTATNLEASTVDLCAVVAGDSVKIYVKYQGSGSDSYKEIFNVNNVTHTQEGKILFGSSEYNKDVIMKNFAVYSINFTAPAVADAYYTAGQTVELTFTQPLASVPATVTLTDATDSSKTFAATAQISSSNPYVLELTLSEELSCLRQYIVTGDIRNIYGSGVSGDITFTTMERAPQYIVGDVEYETSGTSVTARVAVTKIDASAASNVVFITAVYITDGETNTLESVSIDGMDAEDALTLNEGKILTNTVTATEGRVVKSFVWQDITSTMNPLTTVDVK